MRMFKQESADSRWTRRRHGETSRGFYVEIPAPAIGCCLDFKFQSGYLRKIARSFGDEGGVVLVGSAKCTWTAQIRRLVFTRLTCRPRHVWLHKERSTHRAMLGTSFEPSISLDILIVYTVKGLGICL